MVRIKAGVSHVEMTPAFYFLREEGKLIIRKWRFRGNNLVILAVFIVTVGKWLMSFSANRWLLWLEIIAVLLTLTVITSVLIRMQTHGHILNHPKRVLAFIVAMGLALLAFIPFGLLGLTNFIKIALPVSGSQFTYLTINRYLILTALLFLWLGLVTILLRNRLFLLSLYQLPDGSQLSNGKKKVGLKDIVKNWGSVLAMEFLTILIVAGVTVVSYVVPGKFVYIVGQAVVDCLVPWLQLRLFFKLIGLKLPRFQASSFQEVFLWAGFFLATVGIVGIEQQQLTVPKGQQVIVHRGVINQNSQPNSIASLKKNASYNFPYIEMDIQETRDHHFICQHDDSLRIPGVGKRDVNQLTLGEIKKYHHVELFKSYLHIARKLKQRLIVELKVTAYSDPRMGTHFAAQFGEQMSRDHNRVHSIGYRYLRQIKRRNAGIPVGLVTMLNFGPIDHYRVDFYTLQHLTVTPTLLRFIKNSHRPIYTWTDDQLVSMKRARMLGTNGQVTDNAFKLANLRMRTNKTYWVLILFSALNYL